MAKSTSKAKAKTSKHAKAGLPLAPWIYINDTTRETTEVADALSALIPETSANHLAKIASTNIEQALQSADQNTLPGEALIIFAGFEKNQITAAHDANYHREAAIRHGRNFASVNITSETTEDVASGIKPDWGTNHLHLKTNGGIQKTAESIFKWLCKGLSMKIIWPEADFIVIQSRSLAFERRSISSQRRTCTPLTKSLSLTTSTALSTSHANGPRMPKYSLWR
jgi:hypothetical protein